MSQRSYDPLDYLDAGVVSTLKEASQKALRARNADLTAYRKRYSNRFWGFALRSGIRTVYYIQSNDPVFPFDKSEPTARAKRIEDRELQAALDELYDMEGGNY